MFNLFERSISSPSPQQYNTAMKHAKVALYKYLTSAIALTVCMVNYNVYEKSVGKNAKL